MAACCPTKVTSCRWRHSGVLLPPFLRHPKPYRVCRQGRRREDGKEKTPMLDRTDDVSIAAEDWLAQFESAIAKPDESALKTLFLPESYWRDVLALSWNLQTVNGADAVLTELKARVGSAAPRGFRIDPDRAPPRRVSSRRHACDRGDFQIRNRARARQWNPEADPRHRRRQPAEGLDAAHRARRIEWI